MKKYLSLLLVSLFCITLSATNDQNSELEIQANEGMYFQGQQTSGNSTTAYVVADEALTLTCYIVLNGVNKNASYNIAGRTFYLSTNSAGQEIREEVTVSLSKGQNWMTITSNDRRASTALINMVKINGQPCAQRQLVLTPSGW